MSAPTSASRRLFTAFLTATTLAVLFHGGPLRQAQGQPPTPAAADAKAFLDRVEPTLNDLAVRARAPAGFPAFALVGPGLVHGIAHA